MKLSEIQQKLKVPKNHFNSFGKYNYRNCEDILEAVKPMLQGSKLTISDEIVEIKDRFYVKATARFVDETGVADQVSAFARESLVKKGMDEAQITGSTSSYARKYALNGLFCIDDTKDDDSKVPEPKGNDKKSKSNKKITDEILATLRKAYPGDTPKSKDSMKNMVKEIFGTENWTEVENMPSDKLQDGLDKMIIMIEEMKGN